MKKKVNCLASIIACKIPSSVNEIQNKFSCFLIEEYPTKDEEWKDSVYNSAMKELWWVPYTCGICAAYFYSHNIELIMKIQDRFELLFLCGIHKKYNDNILTYKTKNEFEARKLITIGYLGHFRKGLTKESNGIPEMMTNSMISLTKAIVKNIEGIENSQKSGESEKINCAIDEHVLYLTSTYYHWYIYEYEKTKKI